jgi:hypothetical protein
MTHTLARFRLNIPFNSPWRGNLSSEASLNFVFRDFRILRDFRDFRDFRILGKLGD